MPIFVTLAASAIQNKAETSAIAISQQILDEIRQIDISTLPQAGDAAATQTKAVPYNPAYGNNNYRATINYCQKPEFCNANSRHVKVSVKLDSSSKTLYEVETIYTKFQ